MLYQDVVKIMLQPARLGDIEIANRVVMAPMTRARADQSTDMPTPEMGDYYEQRAAAGLIITEGVHPSEDGKGYLRSPGLYNQSQVDAWRSITDRVHDQGGKMVMQIMHTGRIGHPTNKGLNTRILAPSAIRADIEMFTEVGMQAVPEPVAMTLSDIEQTISDYKRCTELAYEAGFDGVELHGTSGYLLAQFLSTGTNQRQDQYGGSTENRLRFVLAVIDAVCGVDGPGKVGLRICPGNPFNDLYDENPEETFAALLQAVTDKRLAYLHAIDMPGLTVKVRNLVRQHYQGNIILNESFDFASAATTIEAEESQAIAFGRPFIANPDLMERFKNQWPIADFEAEYLYTPGPRGYSDYPVYQVNEENN